MKMRRFYYNTGMKRLRSSLLCAPFSAFTHLLILNTPGSHGSPYAYQKANTTLVMNRVLTTNDTRRESEEDRMSKVCFSFPPRTLHLRFPLLQKGNSVPQPLDDCSLLSRWGGGGDNLKIHNFISFAAALGVPNMTECRVFVQNRGGAVRWIALRKDMQPQRGSAILM